MPVGLTFAPSSYQHFMNHILQPHENTFILVYFDGIVTFSNSLDDRIVDIMTLPSHSLPHRTFASVSKTV
jgi:hypothetical protein